MLERIREGAQGFWAAVILGLVILSFVFAGVGSYINSKSDVPAAEVNGDIISQATLEQAYQSERARMQSQFGDAIATLFADENYLKQFRRGILDRLIGQTLLDQKAQELGLRASDDQVKQAIVAMREFQIGGEFNNDRYMAVIRQAGFQANEFRDYMRKELTRQQVAQGLFGSDFALKSEALDAYLLQQQSRSVRYFTVAAEKFKDGIVISDEQVKQYYDQNITSFDAPEQVKLAYVELTLDDVMATVSVDEAEAKDWYEQHLDDYQQEEQRRVSHILIEAGDDDAAAKSKADALLAKVSAGDDFAALAKENSDDTFSAENGGDIDFFGRGIMDPAFEDAAYGLAKVGDVSGVVKSAFGYHIIKLTDVKPAQITAFEDVKGSIEQTLREDKAKEEFYSLQQRASELAFETPDSLDEVATFLNKGVQETALFSQANPPADLNNANLIKAAFSSELIDEGVNSDVIELEENHIVVVRVQEHEASHTKSLDEVKESISSALLQEKAEEAAKGWTDEMLAKLNAGDAIDAALTEEGLNWIEQDEVKRFDNSLPNAVVEALFGLSADNNAKVVSLATGDVSLLQLTGVKNAEAPNSDVLSPVVERLESSETQRAMSSLIEALKADASIKTHI